MNNINEDFEDKTDDTVDMAHGKAQGPAIGDDDMDDLDDEMESNDTGFDGDGGDVNNDVGGGDQI